MVEVTGAELLDTRYDFFHFLIFIFFLLQKTIVFHCISFFFQLWVNGKMKQDLKSATVSKVRSCFGY